MAKKGKSVSTDFEELEAKIRPVDEVAKYLKVLVYGRSGTGKTTFAGSCPGPILLLDVKDKGTASIRNRQGIYVLEVESWAEFEEVYWFLGTKQGKKYKTVVIDTVTQLQDVAIQDVTGGSGMLSQRGWGEVSSKMKTWIMLYRDLKMNVIFTAQDRMSSVDDSDEDEGVILPEMGPYVMPSVSKILCASVDIIGNTFITEKTIKVAKQRADGTVKKKDKRVVQYEMRVGPHAKYTTKLRRDPTLTKEVMPSVVVDPTFDKLSDLMFKGVIENAQEKQ